MSMRFIASRLGYFIANILIQLFFKLKITQSKRALTLNRTEINIYIFLFLLFHHQINNLDYIVLLYSK